MIMKHNQELVGLEEDYSNLKEGDIREEVKFKIDKNTFKSPFTCHGNKTNLLSKKLSVGGVSFDYSVWQCKKCKKEYLDSEQGIKLEKFWMFKRLLEDKLITLERNMNYDGKTFFFRFPKELTKDLHKGDLVNIKLLSPEGKMFLVEIKQAKT
jgi:hypothetical protein